MRHAELVSDPSHRAYRHSGRRDRGERPTSRTETGIRWSWRGVRVQSLSEPEHRDAGRGAAKRYGSRVFRDYRVRSRSFLTPGLAIALQEFETRVRGLG